MSKKVTPCEILGYKVGDEFEVISHHAFKNGQVVTLCEDDGTECPLFSGDGGGAGVFDGVECSFATLNEQVRKIANKLKPAKQALADAINQNGGWVEGGDWHKNGELPPAGTWCTLHAKENNGEEVMFIGVTSCNSPVFETVQNMIFVERGEFRFSPLRTERERAIDEMIKVINRYDYYGSLNFDVVASDIANAMFDEGFRKEVK